MAPIPFQSLVLRTTRYRPHHSSGGVGASLSGGVIAAILGLMLLIFICVFIYKYRKASRIRAETKAPIKVGKILLDSFLIALTFGVAACCCAGCVGDGENGDVVEQSQQPMGETNTGYVPSPMPSYQPQGMDWTPVNAAAQAPVQ